jgi:hypothetical protein
MRGSNGPKETGNKVQGGGELPRAIASVSSSKPTDSFGGVRVPQGICNGIDWDARDVWNVALCLILYNGNGPRMGIILPYLLHVCPYLSRVVV